MNEEQKKLRTLAQELMDFTQEEGKAFGVTDVAVSVNQSTRAEYHAQNGEITDVVTDRNATAGVSIHAGDRVLAFSQNTHDITTLKSALREAIAVVGLAPEAPEKRLLEKEKVFTGVEPDLDLEDKNPPSQAAMIDYALKVDAAGTAVPGIKTMERLKVSFNASRGILMATNGHVAEGARTSYTVVASAIAQGEGEMQSAYEWASVRHFADLPKPEEVGEKAARKALSQLNAVQPLTGPMTLVLSPDAAQELFGNVMSAIDGTSIKNNASFLKDKIGEKVLHESVTIVDQPRIPRAMSSGAVDSVGQEAKDITFVENGVLKNYNMSLAEARRLNLEPIGRNNGSTNLTVLPGTKTPEELIAETGNGIYIRAFTGGDPDVNTGLFSCPAQGLLIENGKLTDKAVDGFVVSGNLKDMFMNVSLANDTPAHPNTKTSFAVPTTKLTGMTIAGK